MPPPLFPKSRQSALAHDEFVIDNLVENGFVVSCMECLHVCNPLLVVTNASGKMNLVLDLRYLCQPVFLHKQKFKYEGL